MTITVQVLIGGRQHDRSSIIMEWDAARSAHVGRWSVRYADRLHGRFDRSYEADYTFIYGDQPRLVPGLLPSAPPVDDAAVDPSEPEDGEPSDEADQDAADAAP